MAETPKPTNEHIIKTLDQILRQLEDVKSSQQRLAADVHKMAMTIER